MQVGDNYTPCNVSFIGADYWKIYQYDFKFGRPFTEKESEDKTQPIAIITQKTAKDIFKKDNPIDEKLSFQGNEYRIIGVVENYASLPNEAAANIWVPYTFNKFTPSRSGYYIIDILFNENTLIELAKEKVKTSLKEYFQGKGKNVNLLGDTILTLHERRLKTYGDKFFIYGVGAVIFLLILIPAVNIITLNIANTENRLEEIAVRRALGATKWSSFLQLITENFILTLIGSVIGVSLTLPMIHLIENLMLEFGFFTSDAILISNIHILPVISIVLPCAIIFTLFSAGIPAYGAVNKNISKTLKGESE